MCSADILGKVSLKEVLRDTMKLERAADRNRPLLNFFLFSSANDRAACKRNRNLVFVKLA